MENKDINTSRFGIGLFIGILVTLILVLTGYIIYDKVITNDKKEIEPTPSSTPMVDEKEISLDLNDKDLANLYNFWVKKVLFRNTYHLAPEYLNELEKITDKAKIITAFLSLNQETISCSKVSNVIYNANGYSGNLYCGYDSNIASKYMNHSTLRLDDSNPNFINELKAGTSSGYSISKVDSKIKELFGTDSYNKVDIDNVGVYHYDDTSNFYIHYVCDRCGGDPMILRDGGDKLISATKKGNIINMKVCLEAENEYFPYEEYSYTFEYNSTTNSYILKSFNKIK